MEYVVKVATWNQLLAMAASESTSEIFVNGVALLRGPHAAWLLTIALLSTYCAIDLLLPVNAL